MARTILAGAVIALLAATAGCRMCAHPYDYCGPTFDGGRTVRCDSYARACSILSPSPYVGACGGPCGAPCEACVSDGGAEPQIELVAEATSPEATSPEATSPEVAETEVAETEVAETEVVSPEAAEVELAGTEVADDSVPRVEEPVREERPDGGWRPVSYNARVSRRR